MKNTASPLRVGMIGAGNISANYLRAAHFFEQMKLVVCAELAGP
jgi:predicted homoserine dehydrogenase-like protein